MTNEEIVGDLKKLYDCKTDFTVTQTGKTSKKVNGFYKPLTHEIFLHNKNFKTDNALIFTAIHELTHHIQNENGEKAGKVGKAGKAHNNAFWSTFYNLLDKAEKLGIYSRERSESVAAKTKELTDIQKQIIELQKKQGKLLAELHKECEEQGDRYEDVLEHDLQISRNKAKELQKQAYLTSDVSDEMSKAINSAKDMMMKKAAMQAADNGATVEQVKAIAKDTLKTTKPTDNGLDSPSTLIKEKKRIERTIEQLNDRLANIEEQLISMGETDD